MTDNIKETESTSACSKHNMDTTFSVYFKAMTHWSFNDEWVITFSCNLGWNATLLLVVLNSQIDAISIRTNKMGIFEVLQVLSFAYDVFIGNFNQVILKTRQHTLTNSILSRNFMLSFYTADQKMLGNEI